MRAVGVDLGDARIGIALSDSAGTVATPWTKVDRCGDEVQDHRHIAALVEEAEAECVVVGLPLSLDGSVGPAAENEARKSSAGSCGVTASDMAPTVMT